MDGIETDNMTQEDIWQFLVTRGGDESDADKAIPWWEKDKDNIPWWEKDKDNVPWWETNQADISAE